MTRWLVAACLVVAMVAFGFGVYQAAEHLRASRNEVHRPTEVSAPSVPGTMYVVQDGAIYRLQSGAFKQITDEAGWMQPSAAPNNQLVAVRRQGNYSDMFLLSDSGATVETSGCTLDADSSARAARATCSSALASCWTCCSTSARARSTSSAAAVPAW